MHAPLDYAPPAEPQRLRSHVPRGAWVVLDLLAFGFVVSQVALLLYVTSVNVRESGVPPYGRGGDYDRRAPGNAQFVHDFPGFAAAIAAIPERPLGKLCVPALVINRVTFSVASWVVAVYLVWRAMMTRGRRRASLACIAAPILATLPYVWPAVRSILP
jgi:hypothetical protein